MRLIDADAIIYEYERVYKRKFVKEGVIERMPTIDAVPVVHGHWVRSDFFSDPIQTVEECSLCGELIGRFSKPLNYCPNCGAKMDEECCADGERKDGTKDG